MTTLAPIERQVLAALVERGSGWFLTKRTSTTAAYRSLVKKGLAIASRKEVLNARVSNSATA